MKKRKKTGEGRDPITPRKRATKERMYHRERYYAMKGTKKKKRKLFGAILQHAMDVLNSAAESASRKDKLVRVLLPYVAHKVTDPARLNIAARKIKHRERIKGHKDARGGKREERKVAAEEAASKKTGKWGNLLRGASADHNNDIRV